MCQGCRQVPAVVSNCILQRQYMLKQSDMLATLPTLYRERLRLTWKPACSIGPIKFLRTEVCVNVRDLVSPKKFTATLLPCNALSPPFARPASNLCPLNFSGIIRPGPWPCSVPGSMRSGPYVQTLHTVKTAHTKPTQRKILSKSLRIDAPRLIY
jgi:hypothetical protein